VTLKPALNNLLKLAVRLVICAIAAAACVRGDHLPDSKRATGPPEHSIAGIDVYSTSLRDLIQRLNAPAEHKRSPETSDRKRETGTVFYEWRLPKVRLRVATMYNCQLPGCEKMDESRIYVADVWGVEKSGGIGRTSAGLRLGDGVEDIKAKYGTRFSKQQLANGRSTIMIQWKDDTTLTLDLDRAGRIDHMQLLSSIE